ICASPGPTPFPYTTLFRSRRAPSQRVRRRTGTNGLLIHRLFRRASTAGGPTMANHPSEPVRLDDHRTKESAPKQPVDKQAIGTRSEEHTSELQSREKLVCR